MDSEFDRTRFARPGERDLGRRRRSTS
jgi:hypothetical protein